MESSIFVVDSQTESCRHLSSCLESAGFTVRAFSTLQPECAGVEPPSLFIFGLHSDNDPTPGGSKGLEGTRFTGIPCLVVTDSSSREHQRAACSIGADDWISKPLDVNEFILKVEALLCSPAQSNHLSHRTADITIDSWAMTLSVRGNEITTTALEFRLLEYLARHPGQVFTRDFLLDAVWGSVSFVNPRSVDACVARLREKIEPDRTRPTMLRTVRGVGYRLDAIATWQSAPSESCGCSACRTRNAGLRTVSPGYLRRRVGANTSSV